MESNWPKAIKYTAIILTAIALAMVLSLTISSLWPVALATIGCFIPLGYSTIQNAMSEWKFTKIERKSK